MNKSQKIILISLIPALLTLLFIIYAVIPTFTNLNKVKSELKKEKTAFAETKNQVDLLKKDKKTLKEIEELKNKLANFEIEIPAQDELAILLVDIEKFSKLYNVKVFSISSNSETQVEVTDPDQKKPAKEKPKKKRRRGSTQENKQELPISLFAIPVELTVIGYYPDVLDFIKALENYQRKITINNIVLAKKDKDTNRPKVEMIINSVIYKSVENKIEIEKPKKEGKS